MPTTEVTAELGHRRLLPDAPDYRRFRGSGVFERIGGQHTVDAVVDRLYDGIESDDELRPLFGRDLAHGKAMQKLFFSEWLGGPPGYGDQAAGGLVQRHENVPITPALAGRWLAHFRRAVEAAVADGDDRTAILTQADVLARALVNRPLINRPLVNRESDRPDAVAWCGADARVLTRARQFARRGDAGGLAVTLAEVPGLLEPSFAAAIMQSAVLAGRTEVVRLLLGLGVDADRAFYLPVGVVGVAYERVIFATPLCASRLKRRPEVEAVLLAAGAREDVFTAAFTRDETALTDLLRADPGLAVAHDPDGRRRRHHRCRSRGCRRACQRVADAPV